MFTLSTEAAGQRLRFKALPNSECSVIQKNLAWCDNPTRILTVGVVAAETILVDRPLTEQEYAIAKWLLLHSTPPATDFLPQLDVARVSGHCGCGCPTADLKVPEGTPKAEVRDNPIGDAIGEVNGKMVGVMLLQRGGYLKCLEIYDLSDIEHPYGLPALSSLRPFEAGM